MATYLKTEDEIAAMRRAGHLVSLALAEISRHVRPGATTLELDRVAEGFIRDSGATPAFKGIPGPRATPFPSSICTSVNDVVSHGIPGAGTVLAEGDIVSVDCGVLLDGFHGDACYTFTVGEVSPEARRLVEAALGALVRGRSRAVAGARLGDIGRAVLGHARKMGLAVVRQVCGHGIGRSLHEDPLVPNTGRAGWGPMLKEGMCLAIEPALALGSGSAWVLGDGWSLATRDSGLAAHFEQTVAVRDGAVEVLSPFDGILTNG